MHRRLGVFRYDVFVGRLGWQLPGADATSLTEWDQFDRGRTIHVVSVDQAQHICGCARLIPTTQPYLLQTLCAPSTSQWLTEESTIARVKLASSWVFSSRRLCNRPTSCSARRTRACSAEHSSGDSEHCSFV
ncbi:GNAT family N-acetyltransferase [Burkholderia cenocepacia]|nr:GNAT family N-acetyltransferase [Burkholderia cenocepacia]